MSANFSKPPVFKSVKLPEQSKFSGLRAAAVIALPVWVAAGFLFAQTVIVATIWLLGALGLIGPLDGDSPVLNAIIAAVLYGTTLLIVMGAPYLVARIKTTKQRLGLSRLPTWTDIGLSLAGAVVYVTLSVAVLTLIAWLVPAINLSESQETGFHNLQSPLQFLLAFVTLIIAAPLAEEVLFRGYLYGNLRRHAPVWLSILVTSLLFGLAHLQWNVGIDVFALSVVLCILREVTGSIWAGILLHMLKNGLAFYLLFIMPSGLLH